RCGGLLPIPPCECVPWGSTPRSCSARPRAPVCRSFNHPLLCVVAWSPCRVGAGDAVLSSRRHTRGPEGLTVAANGGTKAILAALGANAGIAVAKFVGFLITGSSSMLAESVHSVADTSNQGLLLLGQRTAKRAATKQHPFGYGRDRYFYSFIVALMLFTLGSVFALYEGVHKVQHPEDLSSPLVAVAILVVAIALETYSFATAIKESRALKGERTWWGFIRQSKTPELPVVLLEDAGALFGLVFALIGVGLSVVTGDP